MSNEITPPGTTVSPFDLNGLADLRRQARDNDPKALKAAAQQFESLFLQMVLKSMRDAVPREGLFDNDQSKLYESMLDQQLTQSLSSGSSLGLAEMIERQLTRQGASLEELDSATPGLPLDQPDRAFPLSPDARLNAALNNALKAAAAVPSAPTSAASSNDSAPAAATDFVQRLLPQAVEASRTTGIPPQFMIAQAALETGWGRSEPRRADGSPSYNLFGIKAGASWKGDSVEAVTTEVIAGVPQRRTERFRAYSSYAEGFRDYAALLANNPRYADVVGAQDGASFARNLQKAGYATDPAYASKLERIIDGSTLRSAMAG